jgi:hypothetical protein
LAPCDLPKIDSNVTCVGFQQPPRYLEGGSSISSVSGIRKAAICNFAFIAGCEFT